MPSGLSSSEAQWLLEQEKLPARVAGNLAMLCELGSADRIAAYLARKGVKGKRGRPAWCAIAVYLSDRSGTPVGVNREYIDLLVACRTVKISSPEPLREFVRKFDHGDYPGLVKGDDKSPLPPARYPD